MSISITHIGVYVTDIEKSRDYYMTFFCGKSNELYKNSTGFSSYFITFDTGARLEIMHHIELEKLTVIEKATGWSHLAFSVGNKEKVLEITERIVKAGYKLLSPPQNTGDGYFESCVEDPDGNRVEITE
jgi:lactoylglutathione lyase